MAVGKHIVEHAILGVDDTTTLDSRYAPIAKGVTNGDSHDHNGGDGAQIDHINLANKGTNTHTQIDTHIADTSDPHGSTLTQSVSVVSPTIIGGTGTTSDLTLQTTSGVGTTGADMHFLVGNNGGTEAMTILNGGNVGIGTTGPGAKLDILGASYDSGGLHVRDTATPYFALHRNANVGALSGLGLIDFTGNITGAETIFGRIDGATNQVSTDNGVLRFYTRQSTSLNEVMEINGTDIGLGGNITGLSSFTGASMVIKSGNVGIGTSAPAAGLHVAGNALAAGTLLLQLSESSTSGAKLQFRKSRGTLAIPTAVVDGDNIASFATAAYDGTDFKTATPTINFFVDGTVAVDDVPGGIAFFVSDNDTFNQAMTLKASGNVGIGTTAPDVKLHTYSTGSSESRVETTLATGFAALTIKAPTYTQLLIGSFGGSYGGTSLESAGYSIIGYSGPLRIGTWNANSVSFWTSGSTSAGQRMTIDSTGKVGIGTTDPDEPLHVSSSINGFDGVHIDNPNVGSSAAAYLYLTGDSGNGQIFQQSSTNTGYGGVKSLNFYASNGPLAFMSNGAAAPEMILKSGNLGIGTTDPGGKLHVQSANYPVGMFVRTTTATNVSNGTFSVRLKTSGDMTDGFGPNFDFAIEDSAAVTNYIAQLTAIRDGADSSGKLQFRTYNAGSLNTTGIDLDNAGNVGIGIADPGALLHIAKSQDAATQLWLLNAGTGTSSRSFMMIGENNEAKNTGFSYQNNSFNLGAGYELLAANTGGPYTNTEVNGMTLIAAKSTGYIRFGTGGWAAANERMRIDSAGNVGIGNTNPISLLDVSKADAGNTLTFRVSNTDNTNAASHTRIGAIAGGDSAGDPYFYLAISGGTEWSMGLDNSQSDSLKISSGGAPGSTDRLTILTDGNVGIGVTTPATRLEVEEEKTITGAVTDGYAGALTLDPGYTAATAQTVTRHNYIDVQNVSVAGVGPAAVTDACVMRFDAAAGTHLATVGATTKTTPSGVDAWVKININGTIYYMPAYTSTTA